MELLFWKSRDILELIFTCIFVMETLFEFFSDGNASLAKFHVSESLLYFVVFSDLLHIHFSAMGAFSAKGNTPFLNRLFT